MTDWRRLEHRLSGCAPFTRRPVAVTFLDSAPEGVARFTGSEPSGCSFWRLAAEGRTFYTVPSDHFNCAVGSYTHNIDLSPERAAETTQTRGEHAYCASSSPGTRFAIPGPGLACTTPTRPDTRA